MHATGEQGIERTPATIVHTTASTLTSREEAMSVTIRVPEETHAQLRRLAASRKQPIGEVVAAAVERLEEEEFWDQMEVEFERLRADPAAWDEYMAEHREWDVALLDGLEDEPPYYEEGSAS
jgi:predicted transcriptional regulator